MREVPGARVLDSWARYVPRPRSRDPSVELVSAGVESRQQAVTKCREWKGYCNRDGYGRRSINGRMTLVHRHAWRKIRGPIPRGLHVLHHCDNPPCYRISHLFLGTDLINAQDRDRKGRLPVGEDHHQAKLSTDDVLFIRETHLPQRVLADAFGVSQPAISYIKTRRNWKHL